MHEKPKTSNGSGTVKFYLAIWLVTLGAGIGIASQSNFRDTTPIVMSFGALLPLGLLWVLGAIIDARTSRK